MRLQLTGSAALLVALAAGLAFSPHAAAQHQGDARVDVYSDAWITVVSPRSSASIDLSDTITLGAGYGVDVLSGATPSYAADLVTSATEFEEVRHQANIAFDFRLAPELVLGSTYATSLEPDHETHVLGVRLEAEVLQRMSTVGASYHFSVERVGLASGEPTVDWNIDQTLDLSWAQILGPTTTLTALLTGSAATCGEAFGCQANPYRFVGVTTDTGLLVPAREHHPTTRLRGSLGLRLAQRLTPGLALHLGYRLYGDSWEIVGHTATASLAWTLFEDRLFLRADGRIVSQSGAVFYRDGYSAGSLEVPLHRTADMELSRLSGGSVGLTAEWAFHGVGALRTLAITARFARLSYRYPEHSRRTSRAAWVGGGGLRMDF